MLNEQAAQQSPTRQRGRKLSVVSRRFASAVLITATGCAGSNGTSGSGPSDAVRQDEDVVRYRLLLRRNSIDPSAALHCYNECQPERTPSGYLTCLSQCPGFEITPGAYCAKDEVPPIAACLMVRRVEHAAAAARPGIVILSIAGSFALVVTAASLCASSNAQCNYYGYPYGDPPP